MTGPNRTTILLSAALAVGTVVLAAFVSWHFLLDDDRRTGLIYVLLYWPMILIDWLPERISEAVTASLMPILFLYFGGYLLLCEAVRALWRRVR